jgi:hypothetical protein
MEARCARIDLIRSQLNLGVRRRQPTRGNMDTVVGGGPWYRRRGARSIASLVIIALLLPVAWQVHFRIQHPAPWGRSAKAIDRTLARLVPPGTQLDSVTQLLQRGGVDFSVMGADNRQLPRDSLAVGGLVIIAALRNLDADLLFTYSASLRFTFDTSSRLVRYRVEPHITGM